MKAAPPTNYHRFQGGKKHPQRLRFPRFHHFADKQENQDILTALHAPREAKDQTHLGTWGPTWAVHNARLGSDQVPSFSRPPTSPFPVFAPFSQASPWEAGAGPQGRPGLWRLTPRRTEPTGCWLTASPSSISARPSPETGNTLYSPVSMPILVGSTRVGLVTRPWRSRAVQMPHVSFQGLEHRSMPTVRWTSVRALARVWWLHVHAEPDPDSASPGLL